MGAAAGSIYSHGMRRSLVLLCVALTSAACSAPVVMEPPDVLDVQDASRAEDASMDVRPDRPAPVDAAPEAMPDVVDDNASNASDASDASDVIAEDAQIADVRRVESECSNGLDDDGDGAPDCADSDCAPVVQCVAAPEAGWSAPGILNTGATPAACAAPFDTQAYLGNAELDAPPASCAACTCGAPSSTLCVGHYACERSSGCAGTCTAASIEGSGCVNSPGSSATYLPRSGVFASGTCGAGASTPTVTPPTWRRAGRVCTASAGASATGCESGQVCIPRAAAPAPACVVRVGDVACPAGYGTRQVFYGGVDDTRGCSACACRFQSAGCSVAFTAFTQANCAGTGTALTIGTCYTGDPASYRITHTVTSPSCAANGTSSPSGAATPTMASTVCCAP